MKRNGFLFHMVWMALLLGFMDGASASELYNFYEGVRGLGMGGVQVPTVNDETALLINPAALGKLRDSYITVADPQVEMNTLAAQTMGETYGVGALMDPQELFDALQSHPDKHYHVKAQVFPSLVLPNFGIGVFGIERQDAEYDSSTGNIQYDFRRDVGIVMGYNFRFWDGRIKLGFDGRLFDRAEASTSLPAATTGLTYDQIVSEGAAVAGDAGLTLSAPIRYLPSITGVVHDVGGTEFSVGNGNTFFTPTSTAAPSSVRQNIDVGAAIFPILSNTIRMALAVEYRDITTQDPLEISASYRRMHGGMELNFGDAFFLRGGWYQASWTAGMEFSYRFMQIQLASYAADIGTPGTPNMDRRYVFKFAFRF